MRLLTEALTEPVGYRYGGCTETLTRNQVFLQGQIVRTDLTKAIGYRYERRTELIELKYPGKLPRVYKVSYPTEYNLVKFPVAWATRKNREVGGEPEELVVTGDL